MNENRDTSKKSDASEYEMSHLSRRKFLDIFAAVGAIALAPPSGAVSALRIAWLTPAQLTPRSISGMSEIAILNALYDYLFDTDAVSNPVPAMHYPVPQI